MMKRSNFVLNVFAKLFICIMLFGLAGCQSQIAQPGEPVAEGHRRHLRNLSVNQQNLNADIDRALLFDKPIKAAELRIPPQDRN